MEEIDKVDYILAQWRQEFPELDISPMGIVGRVSRLALIIEQRLATTFKDFGLTNWGFDVLATLRRSGPPYQLSPTELFNTMMVSSGTMTNRIDHLEQLKLVKRRPDLHDRRALLIELTPEGRALVDSVLVEHLANEQKILQALPLQEQEQLATLLRKLLASIEGTAVSKTSKRVE
jgi:Transcriptional regulators